jgi:hypothetical protein
MFALLCMTKVTCAVATAAAGANETQADSGFIEREIKRHLEAIALYEDEASSSDAHLRDFAQRILPQLQRQLALLQSLKAGI